MVLNVQGKGSTDRWNQVSIRELNESESYEDMSKALMLLKIPIVSYWYEELWREYDYWSWSNRHIGDKNLIQAFIRNVRGFAVDER